MAIAALALVRRPVDDLRPHPRNARTHSKHQIRQIAESIRAFGFTNPVLIDAEDRILAGHGRLAAARLLGLDEVPTIRLEQMSEDQIRAYVLADNKMAENAGWDREMLALELGHLLTLESADFDITVTGFEVPEIDLIVEEARGKTSREDELPEMDSGQSAVTRPGDLWQLDRHRIFCGDSLEEISYRRLMDRRRAAAVFTDPPYNVRIDGHVCGRGSQRHREFPMASGEMSDGEFFAFLTRALEMLAQFSSTPSLHYLCMDWQHLSELLAAGWQNYDQFLNLCVWVKDNGSMGSLYRSQHELVLVFRRGRGHRNNVQLGRFGRYRTNVWQYPGMATLSKQSEEGNLLELHPTVKPVAMVADAILDCTARGEIVLDAFLGSGTTLVAAERVGRIACGLEMDPLYVDVAIRRWQRYTGGKAFHSATGKSFDDLEAEQQAGEQEVACG